MEPDPVLAKSTLIRELVDLSRFTDGILRTMGSAVVAVDGEGRVAYVNPAAERLLRRPASELLRREAAAILATRGEGDLVRFGFEHEEATGEVDLELPGGDAVTVEARLTRHLDEEDRPDGFVCILTDLTDVKRAETEARRKAQLASLGELAAGVAHEIRNPLAGIAAGAELLRRRAGGDEKLLPLVDVILDEARRLERIVKGLLEFSKPAAPRMALAAVAPCLERVEALMRGPAGERGVIVERAGEEELPDIWMDADQIQQVLLNLARNAVEAMPDGGRLTLEARPVLRPPYVRRSRGRRRDDRALPPDTPPPMIPWVEFRVADTGKGIPPEVRERIFDPFFTTRAEGTGLGLPICQAIVAEHGGRILVEGGEERGTTMVVELPVDRRVRRRRRG